MTSGAASPEAARGDGAANAAVFDPRVLADMFGDDKAIVVAVLKTFIDSMTASLTELHAALGHNDEVTLVGLGHKISGAARMSGAIALAEAAVELERAARAGGDVQLRGAASQLKSQWALLRSHPALLRCQARTGSRVSGAPPLTDARLSAAEDLSNKKAR